MDNDLVDYSKYILNIKEKIIFYLSCGCALFAVGYLFYRNIYLSILTSFISVLLRKYYIEFLIKRRKSALLEGFKDFLYTVATSVSAGRQMETALADAREQLSIAYGADADITKEVTRICNASFEMHSSIDAMLEEFGARSGLSEIVQFAGSYKTCLECGGDIESICLKSCNLILEKITFNQEAKALISEKKLDVVILTAMPILILLFLNLCGGNYADYLYNSLLSREIMTLCLLLTIYALIWGLKITDIKI